MFIQHLSLLNGDILGTGKFKAITKTLSRSQYIIKLLFRPMINDEGVSVEVEDAAQNLFVVFLLRLLYPSHSLKKINKFDSSSVDVKMVKNLKKNIVLFNESLT